VQHYALDPKGILVYSSDVLVKPFRRCVPNVFRKYVLSECHDSLWSGGHLGRDKTLVRIKELYYFQRLEQYVDLWIKTCPTCLATKRKHPDSRVVPRGSIEVSSVWDLLSIDLWDAGIISTRGYKYVLTVIDSFSKYAIAIPIKNKLSKTIAMKLYKHVFSRMGYPKRLHSDLGPEFVNSTLDELCDLLSIRRSTTTAYHPQGNAYAERIHQFFKNALTAFVRRDQRDWDLLIPALVNVYLDSVHSGLGSFTPSQLVFGRKIGTPSIEGEDLSYLSLSSDVIGYGVKLRIILDRVQSVVMKLFADKELKNLKLSMGKVIMSYDVGDKVGLQVESLPSSIVSAKLYPRFSGPYTVVKASLGGKVLYLKDALGKLRKFPVSIQKVKPWPSRQELLDKFELYDFKKNDDPSEGMEVDVPVTHQPSSPIVITEDEIISTPNVTQIHSKLNLANVIKPKTPSVSLIHSKLNFPDDKEPMILRSYNKSIESVIVPEIVNDPVLDKINLFHVNALELDLDTTKSLLDPLIIFRQRPLRHGCLESVFSQFSDYAILFLDVQNFGKGECHSYSLECTM
jgi:ribosomal protein L21E